MAYIKKRKHKLSTSYLVTVQRRGYGIFSKSFPTLTEAKKWSRTMEAKFDRGDTSDYSEASKVTLGDLFKRYISENKQKKNNFNLCSSSKPKNNPKAPKPKPIIQLKTLLG